MRPSLQGATRSPGVTCCEGGPKCSKTKDVYQKFMNILNVQPFIWDPAPAPKPRDPTGDPPIPPGWVDPPPTPGQGNPPPNSGASSGSNWEPGKIPTDEEEPKKLFSYRNPLYNKPSVPPPKVSHPIPPIPHKELKTGEEKPVGGNPSRSGGHLQLILGTLLWITLKKIHP